MSDAPRYQSEWSAVMARLQSCSPDPHGAPRIVSLQVLVNAEGKPVAWGRPRVTVLEPKASALDSLLTELGG